jgi:hypothetical protein
MCDTVRGHRCGKEKMELQEEQINLHNVVEIRLLTDNENRNLNITD